MLKPSEKQFTKEIEGIGTFTFKFPTLIDDIQADTIASKLLAGNPNPTLASSNIATMIGTLKAGIVQKPADFDLDIIYSYEELEAVYNAFVNMVLAFRRKSPFAKQPGAEDAEPPSLEGAAVLVSPEV
jgi:hypothetical protein